MSSLDYWRNEWEKVTETDELFDVSIGNEPDLPNGVFFVKDIEQAAKVTGTIPAIYFVNKSSEVAYVLKEDAEYPTKVKPEQLYIYPIEGAATPSFGVYKIKDFGSIYADVDGAIKPNGIISEIWESVSNEVGYKDESWIKERERVNDMKWVRLYNSVK